MPQRPTIAHSVLNFYKVKFRPDNNAWVDDLPNYLKVYVDTGDKLTIDNFQFIKHGLNLEINIPLSQFDIDTFKFNYVAVQNIKERAGIERIYYYFITAVKWASANAVRLTLSMDTINTFQDLVTWDPKTKIIRQHKDRFKYRDTMSNIYSRIVDRADEGIIGLSKYRTSAYPIEEDDLNLIDVKFYLIYNSDKSLTTDPAEVNPVSCYLVPNKSNLAFKYGGAIGTISRPELSPDDPVQGPQLRAFLYVDNPNGVIKADGVDYTINSNTSYYLQKDTQSDDKIWLLEVENKTSKSKLIGTYTSVQISNIKKARNMWGSYGAPTKFINTSGWYAMASQADDVIQYNAGGAGVNLSNIKDIDRSLTTLLKIIELPYAPSYLSKDSDNNYLIPNGWNLAAPALGINGKAITALKLDDLSNEFGHAVAVDEYTELIVNMPDYLDRYSLKRDDLYESKLFNSAFYNIKYMYDSYATDIKCENVVTPIDNAPTFEIYFKPSNSINSNMIFDIYPERDGRYYIYDTDYGNIITTERNNELPLFNSNYLNYLRNGFNYDLKNKKLQSIKTWSGVGLSIVGAGVAAASAVATGGLSLVATAALGANAISGISNAILNEVSATDKINQTLDETRNQAANVTGSNDLDLLNYYNNNRLWRMDYDIADNVKSKIADLFYFCGYAVNKRGIPDTNSRRDFNYLQCEADFGPNDYNGEWLDYIEDVKTRYLAGVTYYHYFATTPGGQEDYYDFDQEYENFEIWLCERT